MTILELHRVTFTGVDDTTDLPSVAVIAQQHPWVEFAALLSIKQQGSGRYLSAAGRDRFYQSAIPKAQRALHVCGRAVEQFFEDHTQFDDALSQVKRVQLNFASSRISMPALIDMPARFEQCRNDHPDLEFILQYNDDNQDLPALFQASPVRPFVHFLMDASGGRGIAPTEWPAPITGHPTSYAGGIGPGTIAQALARLSRVTLATGIDMESALRTNDRFDLDKVAAVIAELQSHCTPVVRVDGRTVLVYAADAT